MSHATAKGPPLALGNHEPTFSICTDSLNLDIPHDGMSVAMGFFHLVKVYPQCSSISTSLLSLTLQLIRTFISHSSVKGHWGMLFTVGSYE